LPSTANHYRNLDWCNHAVCVGQTDLFFEHRCSIRCHRHPMGCNRLECVRTARAICQSCPVMEHCRIWAIKTHLQHGIAGGMTERERLTIRRQLP
jgi:WhiB family redox-sensing transcriptional regulator